MPNVIQWHSINVHIQRRQAGLLDGNGKVIRREESVASTITENSVTPEPGASDRDSTPRAGTADRDTTPRAGTADRDLDATPQPGNSSTSRLARGHPPSTEELDSADNILRTGTKSELDSLRQPVLAALCASIFQNHSAKEHSAMKKATLLDKLRAFVSGL